MQVATLQRLWIGERFCDEKHDEMKFIEIHIDANKNSQKAFIEEFLGTLDNR